MKRMKWIILVNVVVLAGLMPLHLHATNDAIRIVQASPHGGAMTNLGLAWSATTNAGTTNFFGVFRCTNIAEHGWQLVVSSIGQSGSGTNVWNDTNAFPQVFYRVMATPVAYADGSSNAPDGTPQHPALFGGYAVRPPWMVAGVDYAAGIPAGTVLKDPTIATNLPAGASVDAGNHLIRVTGNNVTLSGFDFSLHGGYGLYITGSFNIRIQNSNFTGGPTVPPPMNADAVSSNIYVGYNTMDGGGTNGNAAMGELIYAAGQGLTVEYNWIKNALQHYVSVLNGGPVVYRCNLLEDGGWQVGAHLNYIQFGGGASVNPLVVFNTIVQHRTLAQGEIIQFYNNSDGSITNGLVGNNVVITVPDGQGNVAASYITHTGTSAQYTSPATGVVRDNYLDARGSYGAFYPGLVGFAYSNNIDLVTGAVQPDPN